HLDPRASQVGKPGGVHADQVIVVEAVFREQFPVGADVVVLRAADHLHLTGRRLVDHDVDIFLGAGEVVLQRHRAGIEVEEYEAAVARDLRRFLQPEIALPEARRIGVLAGNAVELAVTVVAPAVIEADVALCVALGLAAYDAPAVSAGIEKYAHAAPAVAAEDHRPVAHDARPEITGRGHFGLVSDVDPAHVEDPAPLKLEYLRIHQGSAVDPEAHRFRLVDDPLPIVHMP